MADLIFRRARYAGGPVDLVFGALDAPPAPDPVTASGATAFGALGGFGLAAYDNRNPRRVSTIGRLPHQLARAALASPRAAWGLSQRELGGAAAVWQPASPAARETAAPWIASARIELAPAAAWETSSPVATQFAAVHQAALSIATQRAAPHQTARPVSASSALVHQRALSLVRQRVAAWGLATAAQALAAFLHGPGSARAAQLLAPWQTGRPVPPGRELWPLAVLPPFPPRIPSTHLLFACPPWLGSGPVHLLFGRVCGAQPPSPGATLFILPARYYMAVHTLTAQRLPDLAAVPIFDVSLSADVGSFAWTFSASGPASLFEQLAPSAGLPAQIRINLDGIPFVFVVDTISREERFGQRGARIAGRSATALLARPYARDATRGNATARTAQQLAADALEFTGAALDWGLEDWLVPAGAWSHSGTPLAAVQAIVEAAGGYLQSHRSAATLLARHPYPTLPGGVPGGPWNWGGAFAPDVELAPDALITQSIERRDGPDINGVYVSGTSQGVVALVKRAGTAADKLAQMVTDPLITAPEAASQRGLSVLGAGGPKHLVSLSLPVLTGNGQPGVLDVGQLVQVNASPPWRGRVRSVSVNAKLPTARQTVSLERHLEIA